MKRISLLCILTVIIIILYQGRIRKISKNNYKLLHVSLCPSVRTEQLGSHWADFHKILYLSICRKSVEKIQISLKSNKNDGYFIWNQFTFFIISRSFHFRMMFQTKLLQTIKTHSFCSVTFFFFENRAIYEIMWKNIVETCRTQKTIWRMRTACWIT
jgi:hypothetical protein